MKFDKSITTKELMDVDYRYHYSDSELFRDWMKLLSTTEYKIGSQFRPGLKLCQHFFPNFWEIESPSGKSFAKCWQDYDLMDKVREWGLKSMSQLWLSWIRRAVYMAGGLPNSTMYRPHFSKQIIDIHGKKNGVLFDPCAGWAGRALGTIASDWVYYGCEPNEETYDGIIKLFTFLDETDNLNVYNTPAEEFAWSVLPEKVDIVLTSPPYFDLEVYTKGDTQSYNKYNDFDVWCDQWWLPLIDQCLDRLSDDGISAWNVMNSGKRDFVDKLIQKHKSRGWELVDTVGFQSPLANIRQIKNKDVTYLFKLGMNHEKE